MNVFLKKFLALIDTPASFVGQALKLVQVNSAEDALEFTNEIVGPIQVRNLTETETNTKTLLDGEIAKTSDTGSIRLGDGVQEGGFAGNMASSATILCPAIGTPTENGASVIAAHAKAKTMTPNGAALAADNRVLIQGGYGDYDLGLTFAQDTNFIDFAWPGSCVRDAVNGNHQTPGGKITLTGDWIVSCQDAKVSGVDLRGGYFVCADVTNYSDKVLIRNTKAGFFAGARFDGIVDACYLLSSSFASGMYGTVSNSFADDRTMFNIYGTVKNFFSTAEIAQSGIGSSAVLSNVIGGQYAFTGTIDQNAVLLDCATVTAGVYTYLPENVKRKNYSDDPSGAVDLTAPADIEWTNETGYDGLFSDKMEFSNVALTPVTYSVAVTVYAKSVGVAGAAGLITVDSDSFNPDQWVAGTLVDCSWNDGAEKARTDVEILSKTTDTITLDGATGTGDALPVSGAITLKGDPASAQPSNNTFTTTKGTTVTDEVFVVAVPDYLGDLANGEVWVFTLDSDDGTEGAVGIQHKRVQKAVL